MKITEYLNLPTRKTLPIYVGQIYCPHSIRRSNSKVGDKIHYMVITKISYPPLSRTPNEMPEVRLELKWATLEGNPKNHKLQELLHSLATVDITKRISPRLSSI